LADRNTVIEKVNEVFIKFFEIDKDKLKPEALIFDDLGLDSIDIVDLVVALQKQFSVNIRNDERLRTIRTLGDVYDFTESLPQTSKKDTSSEQSTP
jgi:acyl carrier protein